MAVKNIIGWTVSIFLSAIYSFIFATYLTLGYGFFLRAEYSGIMSIVLLTILIFLILLLVLIICTKITERRNIDPNGHIRMILIVAFLVILIPIIKDSPPSKNDYSWDELKYPAERAEKSFEVLTKFSLKEKPDLKIELPDDLDTEHYSNIYEYKDEVIDAWEKIDVWREYINQLNSFDGIADLTGPCDDFLGFGKIRRVAEIYRAYAVLQAQEGNPEKGVKTINEIHSVVNKAFPYARYLIHNLIWTAIAKNNIRTACIISASTECRDKELRLLKDGFAPLFKEETPFSNMFVSEYLFITKAINQGYTYTTLFEELFSDLDRKEIDQNLFLKTFSILLYFTSYKENMTFADIRVYFNHLISNSNRYSEFQNAEEYWELYGNRPSFVNCAGWKLLNEDFYDFQTYYIRMIELTVESDLLSLYLQDRLGEQQELIDCFSGKKYLRSKRPYIYFSVGLDGQADTEDDISLEKWFSAEVEPFSFTR